MLLQNLLTLLLKTAREQISEGCVCRIKNDGNVVFEGSGVEMSEKTAEYIKKNAAKYLVDVTKLF